MCWEVVSVRAHMVPIITNEHNTCPSRNWPSYVLAIGNYYGYCAWHCWKMQCVSLLIQVSEIVFQTSNYLFAFPAFAASYLDNFLDCSALHFPNRLARNCVWLLNNQGPDWRQSNADHRSPQQVCRLKLVLQENICHLPPPLMCHCIHLLKSGRNHVFIVHNFNTKWYLEKSPLNLPHKNSQFIYFFRKKTLYFRYNYFSWQINILLQNLPSHNGGLSTLPSAKHVVVQVTVVPNGCSMSQEWCQPILQIRVVESPVTTEWLSVTLVALPIEMLLHIFAVK